ncbi:SLBB domain-containing protein [Gammaproteobacteria bacterium]|jgi:polysaccharide biosynthesis/export protein|nr:SLBB domain-containing protein [Gammaproteobacteria bacterium]
MNKIKLALIPLISISLVAQELDQDFLNSLPNDIKNDLAEKNSKTQESENYRPYLNSSKLNKDENLLILKQRLEYDLQELEQRLGSDDRLVVEEESKLYGADFFNTFQTTYMPINEPNPDSTYLLDVGDGLEIQLIGQNDYIKDFFINRDGAISLPDIGKITIAGLSLNEASKLIKSKVISAFIGTEAYISLSEIRDVNILISGNAENPGIYTLSGNSNILHALSVSGGINEYGSLREINLIRDNEVIESLDLYDLLINGEYDLKKRLRSGDVIFVEPRKNVVTINGAVKRPAKYEALNEQNLFSIISYANGMKRTADRENIFLERILDGSLKTIPIRNEIQFETIKAIDGDSIYIREYPYRSAKISGAVVKPGSYIMAEGETINDLIEKAGGTTENAYLFGGLYLNEAAKAVNKKSKQQLYELFLDNILLMNEKAAGEKTFDPTSIIGLAQELKKSEPNGRVVIDLLDEGSLNLNQIKDGDELIIPENTNVVHIYGEVSNEGAVMFDQNQDLDFFIGKSGGFKKSADLGSIYILHPNGESELYSKKRSLFESSPKNEVKIYPGSIIFVPRVLDDSTPRRIAAQAYISILGNLGIALASLASLSD